MQPYATAYPLALLLLLLALLFAPADDHPRAVASLALANTIAIAHSTVALAVPAEFWAHVVFGAVMLKAAHIAATTAAPVAANVPTGALVALAAVGAIIGEYATVGLRRLHYVAHAMLDLDILLLALSASAEAAVRARAPPPAEPLLRRIRAARLVIDPCGLAAIGVIFLRHLHDPAPIGVAFHKLQALLLLALAAAVAAVFAATASSPPGSAAGPAAASLHTLVWALNGWWLILMALLMYLWPGRQGLHHLLYPDAEPEEATTIYFAITLLVSAVSTAAWSRARALPHGTLSAMPACATDDDDDEQCVGVETPGPMARTHGRVLDSRSVG